MIHFLERKLIYFPTPTESHQPPPRMENGDIQEIALQTVDGETIHAWHVTTRAPRVATLLFFPGNGGNMSYRLAHIDGMAARGLDVLIIDYRGYGKSSGTPSEPGLYADGDAAYGYLTGTGGVPPGEIVVFGESLGNAVAIDLATREAVAGLVVESGFTSVREVAREIYPVLPGFFFGLLSHRFDNIGKISRVTAPVLVIHGTEDSMVPISMGRALFEAAPEPREWFQVPGADHNDLPEAGGLPYFAKLGEFATRVITH